MRGVEIQPFSEDHLQDAARLLEERHGRHRAVEPLLREQSDFRGEVETLWAPDEASGAVALRDGRVVGYLLGAPRDEAWGANIWVEAAGHAVEETEHARDLYAAAAEHWVEQGRTRHYVLVPADETLVDAWFRVGFGGQHAHGIREVPAQTEVDVPDGFEIRRPKESEIDELIDVGLALPRHQQRSPVFSERAVPTDEEERQEWLDTFATNEEEVLIGYLGAKPVACWSVTSIERSGAHTGLARPDRAAFLGFAATLPEARGSGIGVALTDACFAWAAENDYPTMVTDWRETNLLASRFWPKRGFRRTFLRLYRSIP
ncbi:MAG TPA: GNAT family N-acetyltransferase [Gaiellaceae bacterium]|nr:GNAT family N-acetyltransferase [Gaiellaceae bacterium]